MTCCCQVGHLLRGLHDHNLVLRTLHGASRAAVDLLEAVHCHLLHREAIQGVEPHLGGGGGGARGAGEQGGEDVVEGAVAGGAGRHRHGPERTRRGRRHGGEHQEHVQLLRSLPLLAWHHHPPCCCDIPLLHTMQVRMISQGFIDRLLNFKDMTMTGNHLKVDCDGLGDQQVRQEVNCPRLKPEQ